ncbi:Cadmium-induced protein CadI [Planctomycetes bacterium Pan216]|uniref:Cadmium-induced protein CadI n=1 Tax=Kolteria novifilia TaxID=2527975 RepID=A0A518B082_9BACT|nr:Cadmium-induced protein CadI [Planctomycetes bacterium Pan216]
MRLLDSAAMLATERRLVAAGASIQREEGVECCNSRQTKFWVHDPDGVLWEIYLLHEDIDHFGAGSEVVSVTPAGETSASKIDKSEVDEPESGSRLFWEHSLGTEIPTRLPFADGSLDEVRLNGTFNTALDEVTITSLLREVYRSLKEGGVVKLHTLVADRPVGGGELSLPGPASVVKATPMQDFLVRALRASQFTAVRFTKFKASPCFVVDEIQLRESMLEARKVLRGTGHEKRLVLYKGPMAEVRDGAGNIFACGEWVTVAAPVAETLRDGPNAEMFVVV